MKPTIGIIGGSGPLATLDIEKKILSATQRIISPLTDQDYFNLVVFNYSETYDRNDSVFFGRPDPLNQYIKHITSLSIIGVDLILIACNTAHMHLPALKEKTKIQVISIIENTIKHIRVNFPDCCKVGLISTKATLEKGLYHNLLEKYGIKTITPEDATQNLIMEAIYLIKSGIKLDHKEMFLKNPKRIRKIDKGYLNILERHPYKRILLQDNLPNPSFIIKNAIQQLKNKGCRHIIFGCTELPLVLPYLEEKSDINFIDPNSIISEAIVEKLQEIENSSLENLKILETKRKYI